MLLACDQLLDITCKEIDSSRSYSATRSCFFEHWFYGIGTKQVLCGWLRWWKANMILYDTGGGELQDLWCR